MTDELRPPLPQPTNEPPEEADEEEWKEPETDLDATPAPTQEPPPIYGQPAERHLGREIPLWVFGAAVLVLVAVITLIFSLVGGGGESKGTPTPNATEIARQATLEAMAATPTPVPPTPTPTPMPKPTLGAGGKAVVVNSEPEGIRMRAGPGLNNATLDIFRDGAVFDVLSPPGDVTEYPVKADNYLWWRVRAEDGLVGWVAQGDDKQTWLVPLPADATPTRSPQ